MDYTSASLLHWAADFVRNTRHLYPWLAFLATYAAPCCTAVFDGSRLTLPLSLSIGSQLVQGPAHYVSANSVEQATPGR